MPVAHKKKCGTDLVVDHKFMLVALKKKRKLLGRKKASYLNQKIAESIGKKYLLKIEDSLLIKKPGLKLPCHESPWDITNQFGEFFCEKGLGHQETFRSCLVLVIRRSTCHYASFLR